MEFKGTKGVWEIVVKNETGALITGMNGNESICTVWGSVDEFEANAKLIESAPEMFELLKKILKENHCTSDTDTEIEHLLTKITQ